MLTTLFQRDASSLCDVIPARTISSPAGIIQSMTGSLISCCCHYPAILTGGQTDTTAVPASTHLPLTWHSSSSPSRFPGYGEFGEAEHRVDWTVCRDSSGRVDEQAERKRCERLLAR